MHSCYDISVSIYVGLPTKFFYEKVVNVSKMCGKCPTPSMLYYGDALVGEI